MYPTFWLDSLCIGQLLVSLMQCKKEHGQCLTQQGVVLDNVSSLRECRNDSGPNRRSGWAVTRYLKH